MDFLTTARMLMDMRERYPTLRYNFENGYVVMRVVVYDDVPDMFEQAAAMFEPA